MNEPPLTLSCFEKKISHAKFFLECRHPRLDCLKKRISESCLSICHDGLKNWTQISNFLIPPLNKYGTQKTLRLEIQQDPRKNHRTPPRGAYPAQNPFGNPPKSGAVASQPDADQDSSRKKWREFGMQHWSCKPTNKRTATKPNKAPRNLKNKNKEHHLPTNIWGFPVFVVRIFCSSSPELGKKWASTKLPRPI